MCLEKPAAPVTSFCKAILRLCILLQLVIMLTPVRVFFHVRGQSWREWLFATGTAAGCIPLSIVVKLVTRLFAPKALDSNKKSSVHPL